MPSTHKIFIDSSVLIAFIDRADGNHPRAVKALENLAQQGYQLYTSMQNINETYTSLSREVGATIASEFLEQILQSNIEILFPQKADLISAFRILKTNREKQLTLREVLSATLMQKRAVFQIITFHYWHNLFGTQISNLSLD